MSPVEFATEQELPELAPGAATARDTIKVLHLVNGELFAGAERVQDLLAKRLGEFGYDVAFAALKSGRFDTERQARNAQLMQLGMLSRLDLRPALRVAKLVRSGGFRLIHTHTPRAALIGRPAAALAGVPMVHHLHSPANAEYKGSWRNRVNGLAERLSVAKVAALIAVSKSVAEHARAGGLARQSVFVVHNGVPVLGPLAARCVPRDRWTLGTAALFRPRKGLEVLLESLAMLRRKGHKVRLRAIGTFSDQSYEKQIHALVARLALGDAIDWVGFSRDVIGQIQQTDIAVLPSLFGEGLPMAVLEAMSAGVPVVATRVEGVPEAIRDGVDGLIVNPADPADLARGIEQIMTGQVEWSVLRTSAHRRQAEAFSDCSMAEGVAAVYDHVLARR